MCAREAVPEYIAAMIREAHFPIVSEDELTDAKVYKGLTEEYDLAYQGYLGGAFMEEVQRAVRMTRLGDACQGCPSS